MSRFDNNCLWITSGFDDRFAVPVLVGEVGGYREMRDARVPDLQDVDVADIPSDFDSVELFHSCSCLIILCQS